MQVLSKSIAKVFEYYGDEDEDTLETQRFVTTFDCFFDMMNTRCLEEGMQKRKPDLAPYKSPNDDRLKIKVYVWMCIQLKHCMAVCMQLYITAVMYGM